MLVAAVISVVALLVYLWLAPSGMWLDEAVSARITSLPVGTFVRFVTHSEPNMVLFHGMLAPLSHTHPSDAVLRVLPAMFGALALGTTYLLGVRILDRGTAVVATAVLAASGLTSAYANQIRGYSLLLFLTVLSTLLLVRAVQTGRTSAWVAFTVVAVLSLGAQQVALFTIVAQFLSLLVMGRSLPWRRVVPSGIAIVAAFGAWRLITRAAPQSAGVSWIPPLSARQVLDTLRSLTGGTNITLAIVGVLGAVGIGLAIERARRAGDGVEAWPDVLLVATALVPLLLGLVASAAQPLFLSRYYLACLPPIALLVARAVTALPRKPIGPIAGATAVVFAVLVANPTIDLRARDGSPAAVEHLVSSARPGDALFLPYNEELPMLQWYADGRLPDGVVDPRPGVPPDAITTGWWWDEPTRMSRDLASAAQLDPDEWRSSLADLDRVWVLRGFLADDPRFHDAGSDIVPEGRQLCEQGNYDGVTLELWARSCQ